ncbi:unnamed protein product, partial [Dovyalis caffra]
KHLGGHLMSKGDASYTYIDSQGYKKVTFGTRSNEKHTPKFPSFGGTLSLAKSQPQPTHHI